MKEYGSEAPRKFSSLSKYRDLDSPPPPHRPTQSLCEWYANVYFKIL